MEKIMNDNDSKAFLKEMARIYPEYKDNFRAVSNLIVLLMEELQEERDGRKEGEKYKKMWGKLGKEYGWCGTLYRGRLPDDSGYVGHDESIKEVMNRVKQNYFPKLVKRTIRIEIEGGDDIDLGLAKMIMKKALTDWNFEKDIKFKECD